MKVKDLYKKYKNNYIKNKQILKGFIYAYVK